MTAPTADISYSWEVADRYNEVVRMNREETMRGVEDVALWCALNQLISGYWADVDENGGQTAHEFYSPNALYVIGNNRFEGRDKIQAFYDRRRYGTIRTRHVVSNVRVLGENSRRARMLGLMTLYRADGKSPFQGARPPAMIADFDAQCVWGDETTNVGVSGRMCSGRSSSAATFQPQSRSDRRLFDSTAPRATLPANVAQIADRPPPDCPAVEARRLVHGAPVWRP